MMHNDILLLMNDRPCGKQPLQMLVARKSRNTKKCVEHFTEITVVQLGSTETLFNDSLRPKYYIAPTKTMNKGGCKRAWFYV